MTRRVAVVACFMLIGRLIVATSARAQTCGEQVVNTSNTKDKVSIVPLGERGQSLWWRENRDHVFLHAFVTFIDSSGRPGQGWPANGVEVPSPGRLATSIMAIPLSPATVMAVWSDQSDTTDYDVRVATLHATLGSDVPPSGLATDTVAILPGAQFPIGIVRQDDTHALVVIQDRRTTSHTLIKHLAISGAPVSAWPRSGVVLDDSDPLFPAGLAAVAACTDDSSGCFILTAGTTLIDDFHYSMTLKLHRLLADGTPDPRWPPSGLVLTNDGDEFNQAIPLIPDGQGGIYAAWTTGNHSVSGLIRVILQHIDRDGRVHAAWEPSGKTAMPSATAAIQYHPHVALAPQGGVVLLLEEDLAFLRLKAFSAGGTSGSSWPDSGIALGDASGATAVVSGGSWLMSTDARIVAAWSARAVGGSGSYSSLAVSVGFDGSLQVGWSAQGRTLCPSGGTQQIEAVGMDLSDRFALSWRTADDDLWFARFSAQDGVVPVRAVARLLAHSVSHRILSSTWAFSGSSTIRPVGLIRQDGALSVRGTITEIDRDLYSLRDSLPREAGEIEYMLGVMDGSNVQIISDPLRLSLAPGDDFHMAVRVLAEAPSHEFLVELTLASDADRVELGAFDVLGRVVGRRSFENLTAGSHRVSLPAPFARAGVYFVRASREGSSVTARGMLLD